MARDDINIVGPDTVVDDSSDEPNYIDGVTYNGHNYGLHAQGGTITDGLYLTPGTDGGIRLSRNQDPLLFYLGTTNNVESLRVGAIDFPLHLYGNGIVYQTISGNNPVTRNFTFKDDFTLSEDGTVLTINLD